MGRRLACLLLAAVLLGLGASPVLGLMGAPVSGPAAVVVLAPYLRWDDLSSGELPYLSTLVENGDIANANVNGKLGRPSERMLDRSVLSLSAGAWAEADVKAAAAYSVDEPYENGTAADAYRRLVGAPTVGASVVDLGVARQSRASTGTGTYVALGTLGEAVRDGGGRTIALGNSDPGLRVPTWRRSRPAATMAMDTYGRVDLGDVSSRLLKTDRDAPFGVATDRDQLLDAFDRTMKQAQGRRQPVLAVIDPGDLHRAFLFAPDASPERAENARRAALRSLDELLRGVVSRLPEGASLYIVAPVPAVRGERVEPFAPLVIAREGLGGPLLTSSSTHRPGLVTGLDVTATILDRLGLDVPVQVLGNPMRGLRDGLDGHGRTEALQQMQDTAYAVDIPKGYIVNGFIVAAVVVILVAALLVTRPRLPRWLISVVEAALLLVLAVPVSGTLMFTVYRWPASPSQAVTVLAATALALWVVSLALSRLQGPSVPIAFMSLLTAGVILVEQWVGGGKLSFTSFFGFSPVLGARYYGLGNEGASILVGSLVVGFALVMDETSSHPISRLARVWLFPVVGLGAVLTAAAPFLGANVGVAIWGTIAVAVAWAGMSGRGFGWRSAATVALVVVALIAAFSLVDVFAGAPGAQTHLGRAWMSAQKGGMGELWAILSRKAETNLRVLSRTNWSYLLFVVLGLLAYMRARPGGAFGETLRAYPAFGAALTAGLVGGLFGYLTEDSGIVIPALVMLYVGAGLLFLMLSRKRLEAEASS